MIVQYPAFKKISTHTARLPRQGERSGIDNHFYSLVQNKILEQKGFFTETGTIHCAKFRLSKNEVKKTIESEKPVLANIDVLADNVCSGTYQETIHIILLHNPAS